MFPFCCQKGRLQFFRQNRNQGNALLRGQQDAALFPFFAFDLAGFDQLFNDPGTGGGRAQSLAFRVIRRFFRACILHGR